jgi:hypothetical protein
MSPAYQSVSPKEGLHRISHTTRCKTFKITKKLIAIKCAMIFDSV